MKKIIIIEIVSMGTMGLSAYAISKVPEMGLGYMVCVAVLAPNICFFVGRWYVTKRYDLNLKSMEKRVKIMINKMMEMALMKPFTKPDKKSMDERAN